MRKLYSAEIPWCSLRWILDEEIQCPTNSKSEKHPDN